MVMPINTINTLDSDNMMVWCGIQNCDVFIADEENYMKAMEKRSRQAFEDYMDEVKEVFTENGIGVESVFFEGQFRFKLYHEDKRFEGLALQGIGSDTEKYEYIEGTAPIYANEIALSSNVADSLGVTVGETVYVLNGNEKQPFVVTAIYQSMLNMGENFRFPDSAELDYANCSGGFGLQFVFDEDYDIEEIEKVVTTKYKDAEVIEPKEYLTSLIGDITSSLKGMKLYIIVVVILINVLVVSLMQKMFLTRERGQIAMLKMQGFDNVAIFKWQIKRIMLILFVGILLGTLTGTFFSQWTAGMVFKFMGLSKVVFEVNPMEVYVAYPIILFVTVILAAMIGILGARRISEKEVNDME